MVPFYLYNYDQNTNIQFPSKYAPDGVHSVVCSCVNGASVEPVLCNVAGTTLSFCDLSIGQFKYGRMIGNVIWTTQDNTRF